MPQGLFGTSSSSRPFDRFGPVEARRPTKDSQTRTPRIHPRQVTTYRLHRSRVHEYNNLHCAIRARHWRPEICLEASHCCYVRLRCYRWRWNICLVRAFFRQGAYIPGSATHPLRCCHVVRNPSPAELFSDRSKT
jgi:hypothetical protein